MDEHNLTGEEAYSISEARLKTALRLAKDDAAQHGRTKSQLRVIIDASQEAMLFLLPDGRPLKVNTSFTQFLAR